MSDTTLMQRLRHMAGDCNALAIFREAADALEQQARELNDAINEFTAANAEIERQAAQIAEKDAEIARVTAELEALKGDLDPLFKDLADYGEEIEALRADAERLRASAEKVILFNRDHANDQYGDPNKAEAWACVRELRAALRQEQPAKPEPEVFSAGNPYCRECGCERLAYQYECASGRIYKCTRCGTEMQWVQPAGEGEK